MSFVGFRNAWWTWLWVGSHIAIPFKRHRVESCDIRGNSACRDVQANSWPKPMIFQQVHWWKSARCNTPREPRIECCRTWSNGIQYACRVVVHLHSIHPFQTREWLPIHTQLTCWHWRESTDYSRRVSSHGLRSIVLVCNSQTSSRHIWSNEQSRWVDHVGQGQTQSNSVLDQCHIRQSIWKSRQSLDSISCVIVWVIDYGNDMLLQRYKLLQPCQSHLHRHLLPRETRSEWQS